MKFIGQIFHDGLLHFYSPFDMVRNVVLFSLKKQPMEVYVDDETKLTLHGLQQYYVKLKDQEKNRKLFDLLDVLEFNQVFDF